MTRYAIDAATAIRIVQDDIEVRHDLVAPKMLHSQALYLLYTAVRRGELSEKDAKAVLLGITTMKIRLLGDRVSRATAWRVATELDWDEPSLAEYVAVAQLQADAFVTVDDDLARRIHGVVELAPFSALST